jgi:hypothetical protein
MNDTTPEMHQFQYDLIMSKTPTERFEMGLEMMESGRELMVAGIKAQNPDIKESEIVKEIIKRQYKNDKSLFWLQLVIEDFNE